MADLIGILFLSLSFFFQNIFSDSYISFWPLLDIGPKRRVIVDIGSNTGSDWALPGVLNGKHVVYSFEPNPAMVTNILESAKKNKIPFTLIEDCKDAATIRHAISKVKVDKNIGHLFVFPAAASDAFGKISLL